MGVARTYLSAVAAGALTAGVAAANVVAVPPERPESPDVDLAVTIFDFTLPLGPLTIVRKLVIEGGIDPLELILEQEGGNTYDLPGLNTAFDSTSTQHVLAERVPGEYIDFGWTSDQFVGGGWSLLGDVLTSSYVVNDHRDLHFRPLLGGSEGIGAALYGTLSDDDYDRQLTFFDSGLHSVGHTTIGDFNGELALLPWDGFKVVGGGTERPDTEQPPATLIDTNRDTTFNLGSLTGEAKRTVTLDGRAGLCLGSAQGTTSCGGNLAFLEVGAPVTGGLTLGSTNIISGDFSTNRVVAELGQGQFSVTGAVGGTVTVGNLEIGRPIPIDFQIPRASSLTSLSGDRQASTVKDSFKATPRKLGSDNETGGRHRAPLREAVANIKTAVDNAVSGKHAKPAAKDSEDD